jgi:hypothetical protein
MTQFCKHCNERIIFKDGRWTHPVTSDDKYTVEFCNLVAEPKDQQHKND